MELHDLRPAKGATKDRKRVGRGHGSGQGKTSGRGTKGQLSRSGGGKGPGFEGGQNPLQRRLPKLRGFKNLRFRREFQPINIGALSVFEAGSSVGRDELVANGLIRSDSRPVKVLGDGELNVALTVRAESFSKSAISKIESAGGKAEAVAATSTNGATA